MKPHKFKIKIMGKTWTVVLFDEFEFLETHPNDEDTGALTLPGKREIHFQLNHIDLSTCRHEVRHAFTTELCIESANITTHQMEEIQCTLDENRWEEMDSVSKNIFEKLSKAK